MYVFAFFIEGFSLVGLVVIVGFNIVKHLKPIEKLERAYTPPLRMYLDMDTRIIIDEQLEKFKNAEGMFGMDMAKLTRDKKQPGKF